MKLAKQKPLPKRHKMTESASLKKWLKKIATYIDKNQDIPAECYAMFVQTPSLAIDVVDILQDLDEALVEKKPSFYTACVFVLDVCVSQLQAAQEHDNKQAEKHLNQLMAHLATMINSKAHTLSYWLSVLNAFYEVHVELSAPLKEAYLELANEEGEAVFIDETTHLTSIRDLILELSDLSVFDIAENFFAQSYAMPADFFIDLVIDLYNIEEGQDIALLTLLHPKQEVRDLVVSTLDSLMPHITLSPISLSRLQQIKNWYPAHLWPQFDYWIKLQRKKEVIFHRETHFMKVTQLKATEIDGGGAQGIFIQLKKRHQYRLCGLLFKQKMGIKDAWITPPITASEVQHYYQEAFDDNLSLRTIDVDYLCLMTNHFLACMLEQGEMPNLHLLEIQEALGRQFIPQKLDIDEQIEKLSVQIVPFTTNTLETALKRSGKWLKKVSFTESWFIESALVDKLVNQSSSFIDGIKICELDDAIDAVFKEDMEFHRDQWLFHFLWTALWLKSKQRANSHLWQDCFMIAYAIYSGTPLQTLPLLREICRESVLHSIETMQERKTYLSL